MEFAIKKVLEMLEQRKITPEEAEKLIRVIKESGKKEKASVKEFSWWNLGAFISEIIGKSIKESLNSAFIFAKSDFKRNVEIDIPAKEKINIISKGGDIKLQTRERDKISIKADAMRQEDKGNEVLIEIAGDGEIILPEGKELKISIQGGNIETKGNFKNINLKMMGGDINAELEFENANIKMFGGDFTLRTSQKPLQINLKSFGGGFEIPEGFEKKENVYIYGETGHKEINLEMFGGDFKLEFQT